MSFEVTQDTGLIGVVIIMIFMLQKRVNKLCKDVSNLKGRHGDT